MQKEPVEGAPAVNDSRVWLLYDNDALYVGAINYDDDPPVLHATWRQHCDLSL